MYELRGAVPPEAGGAMGSAGGSEEQSFFGGGEALEVPFKKSGPDPSDCCRFESAMMVYILGPSVY